MSNTMYLVTGAAGFLGGTIAVADRGIKGSCYILGNEEVTSDDYLLCI